MTSGTKRPRSKRVRVRNKVAARKPRSSAGAAADAGGGGAVRLTALRRIAKGGRAQFYENEAVDQLFAVVTALTAELSVAFDRIDTLERVLVGAGALDSSALEAYLPSEDAKDARSGRRESLIQRVFAVFEAYEAGAGG